MRRPKSLATSLEALRAVYAEEPTRVGDTVRIRDCPGRYGVVDAGGDLLTLQASDGRRVTVRRDLVRV